MKKVLITGGTGLIGQKLSALLLAKGYKVAILSRSSKNDSRITYYNWDIPKGIIDEKAFENVYAIIHLTGANIGKPWTSKHKKEIKNSRVNSTKLLLQYIKKLNLKPDSFISASAIGYYGTATSEKIYSEEDPCGNDFLANTCREWEIETKKFIDYGIRTVILRAGVVLSKKGGALSKMLLPAKLGLNSAIGSGKQYMPWIHSNDLCNMYVFAMENPQIRGVYNAVSSEHTTNREFSYALSSVLKKPFFMPNIPTFVLKMLFGKMAVILLEGSRISNRKIKLKGFHFEQDTLREALKNIFY